MYWRIAALLAIVSTLTACLGNDSGGTTTPPTEAAATETPASSSADDGSATEPNEATATTSDGGDSAALAKRSSATLMVGVLTWTFDNFYCRFGPENTGNDWTYFSSGSFSTHEGVRAQLAESGFLGSAEFVIQIVGDQVTVDAAFDDTTTDGIEAIPGTLEATCEQG